MKTIAALIIAIASLLSSTVVAQELDEREEALALAVAQVCANERSLSSAQPADCALIWQAVRHHGSTTEDRLAWLTRHSDCVLTDRDMTARELLGNCRWSRYLTASDARPLNWPTNLEWSEHTSRWERMRSFCRGLVAGRTPRGGFPCPLDPDTWGGRMDHDRAISRGMRSASCAAEGLRNQGYFFASPHRRR
jgi:hypothetical protein